MDIQVNDIIAWRTDNQFWQVSTVTCEDFAKWVKSRATKIVIIESYADSIAEPKE